MSGIELIVETPRKETLIGDTDGVAAARQRAAMTRRPFLRARWLDLLLVTYAVPDDVLTSRLPVGLELDRWQGHALISLVAFDPEHLPQARQTGRRP